MPVFPEVLHYTGSDHDRGGVISVIRNLAGAGQFACILGVNPGCVQTRRPALPVLELPPIAGEKISPATMWGARPVARAVQAWLRAGPARVFHGHSRAGLLVALWLARWGERRVVVSVHCYGRQRWFYRWSARRLEGRLYWLSPAMKHYYGVGDTSWDQCVPGCLAPASPARERGATTGGIFRVGGIGALVRWKKWDLVLAALAQLPAAIRTRVIFRHIGTDDGSADSQAYAAELRATPSPQVEWLGQRDSSADFLRETDCLVVASQDEPFSVAMLEALQAGVPVLAADSGGARDIVMPGGNGALFRSGDAGDLARQLGQLADEGPSPGAVVAASELSRFSAAGVAARWAEIYRTTQPQA